MTPTEFHCEPPSFRRQHTVTPARGDPELVVHADGVSFEDQLHAHDHAFLTRPRAYASLRRQGDCTPRGEEVAGAGARDQFGHLILERGRVCS
jgi:hypothetical protein